MGRPTRVMARSIPCLSYAEYAVLLTIVGTSRHSISIFNQLLDETNQKLILSPNTLYAALKRLYSEDLISIEDEPTLDSTVAQPRKCYRATPKGREAIIAMRDWMGHEVSVINTTLETAQPNEPPRPRPPTPRTDQGQNRSARRRTQQPVPIHRRRTAPR